MLNDPLENGCGYDIGVQLFADVDVALHDVLERSVQESDGFFTMQTWLVPYFGVMETFIVDNGDVFFSKLVGLLLVNFRSRFELCIVSNSM